VSPAALGAVAALLWAAPAPTPAQDVDLTAKRPVAVADERLSRGWLRHWADLVSTGGERDRARARLEGARLLIVSRWVLGEAAERGIVVTRAETTRALRMQRKQAFPNRRDYRRFLRRSGQTPADIRTRVRVVLHGDKLRDLATAGTATPEEAEAALEAFVRRFNRKWRARTACRPPWDSEFACGDVRRG
jgi:hypothetical protein